MPADIKSAPQHVRHESLQGRVFTPANDQERLEAINEAFDYRGDVTLKLTTGEEFECFIFNRNPQLSRIELFTKDSNTPRYLPYAEVAAIAFTGKDNADGKSWEAWVSKKESERKAEAEHIRAELEAQGHL